MILPAFLWVTNVFVQHYNSLRPKRTLSETMKSVFTGT